MHSISCTDTSSSSSPAYVWSILIGAGPDPVVIVENGCAVSLNTVFDFSAGFAVEGWAADDDDLTEGVIMREVTCWLLDKSTSAFRELLTPVPVIIAAVVFTGVLSMRGPFFVDAAPPKPTPPSPFFIVLVDGTAGKLFSSWILNGVEDDNIGRLVPRC